MRYPPQTWVHVSEVMCLRFDIYLLHTRKQTPIVSMTMFLLLVHIVIAYLVNDVNHNTEDHAYTNISLYLKYFHLPHRSLSSQRTRRHMLASRFHYNFTQDESTYQWFLQMQYKLPTGMKQRLECSIINWKHHPYSITRG